MKDEIFRHIEQNAGALFAVADAIFDKPEMCYKEAFASALLAEQLENMGYAVERGCHGVETAFKAVYENGGGGPSIGLLCEYDALPNGHACGHHLQGPIMIAAAEAIRHNLKDTPYKLVIYGTPAEEGGQGKLKMQQNGAFCDIDVSLMTHAAPNTTVDIKSLSGSKWSAKFTGVAAHESLTPELARSGMDAMLVAFYGLEFMRGHVREDVKISYSVKDCKGTQNNKSPVDAECIVEIRTYHDEDLPGLDERICAVLEGAALMSGTKVAYEKLSTIRGKLPSYSLNKIIMDNAALIGSPQLLAFRERTGSTDYGFVSHQLPSAVSRFALVPEGSTSHSQIFVDYGKTDRAHDCIINAAKIIAASVYDLVTEPETLRGVTDEFAERKADYIKRSTGGKY